MDTPAAVLAKSFLVGRGRAQWLLPLFFLLTGASAVHAQCPTPTGVHATVDRCDGVLVTWDPVPGAISYSVNYNTSPSGGGGNVSGSLSTTSYLASIGAGDTRYFRVRAYCSGVGSGAYSGYVIGTRLRAPLPPSGLAASQGTYCDRVSLSWNAVSAAATYRVWRGGCRDVLIYQGGLTTCDDFNAPAGPNNYYVDAVGSGLNCESNGCHGPATGFRLSAPATPTAPVISPTCQSLDISWAAVPNADTYQVYRDGVLWRTVAGTSTSDSGLFAGESHSYSLRAVGVCGSSGVGSPASGAVLTLAPPPSGLAATGGTLSCGVRVQWSPVSQATGYKIYRSTSAAFPSGVPLAEIQTATQFLDQSALDGVHYYYFIVALRCGDGTPAGPAEGWRALSPFPPSSVSISTQAPCESLRISWSAAPEASSYHVWRSETSNPNEAAHLAQVLAPASATVDVVVPRITYYYWITTESSCGRTSPWSQAASAMVNCPCATGAQMRLTAVTHSANDQFGAVVSSDAETIVIGEPLDDTYGTDAGLVWVRRRTGVTWGSQSSLRAPDGDSSDRFGHAVAVDSGHLLVGAPFHRPGTGGQSIGAGTVYPFVWNGDQWVPPAIGLVANDYNRDDHFGWAVDADGDLAVIGAPGDDQSAGSVYVFRLGTSGWTQEAKLVAPDRLAGDQFGAAVSLDGAVIAVGSRLNDNLRGANAGAVYVYSVESASWVFKQKLIATDGAIGDEFGTSVSVDGDVTLVGAPKHDHGSSDSGSAYVFRFHPTTASWLQEVELRAGDAAASDAFGTSVTIDGGLAGVGAPFDDDAGASSGAVYLYRYQGSLWNPLPKVLAADAAAGDSFGTAVTARSGYAFVGAPGDDSAAGSAYIITLDSGPPVITTQPEPQAVALGMFTLFTVAATGSEAGGPLTYQWRKNGVAIVNGGSISGARSSVLEINPVAVSDAGIYSVVVENACATTTSNEVQLTVLGGCYANCDGSTAAPVLNVNDFICFQTKFAAGDSYANCDNSTSAPVLNINDFICFQQKFAAGCP